MREWGNERGRKKEWEREIEGQGRRMRKGERRSKRGREGGKEGYQRKVTVLSQVIIKL